MGVFRWLRSIPGIGAALPRVAAVSLEHEGVLLPESTFASVRPEYRFDLILVGRGGTQDGAWFERARKSCRALLVEVDSARKQELLATSADHVLAAGTDRLLIRGALSYPLIRIDDYPSGVRPFSADLSGVHAVLALFESHSVPYTLGIVPGILDERMLEHLSSLTFMTPAQHGFDHQYPKYSRKLIARGDPENQRGTVGIFNEFAFTWYRTILRKLRAGKELLEQRLQKPVRAYIPPCNVCDRSTSKALEQLGFELCLCDKPVRSKRVPVLGSDFYGRSSGAKLEPNMEVLCLHTNWEWDVARVGDREALPRFLDRVLEIHREKERAISALAASVQANPT